MMEQYDFFKISGIVSEQVYLGETLPTTFLVIANDYRSHMVNTLTCSTGSSMSQVREMVP